MAVATRIALCQLLVGCMLGVVWWAAVGPREALAAGYGGGASALLSFYTGLKTFGRGGYDPEAMLLAFFRAQAWKWVLAVLLFGVAVKLFSREFVPLITSYAATLAVYWFSLLWEK